MKKQDYSRHVGEKTAVGKGSCGPTGIKFKLRAYQGTVPVGCGAWAPFKIKISPVSFGKRHPVLRRGQNFSAPTGGQYLSSPATVTRGSFYEKAVEGQSSLQFWAELGWTVQSQTHRGYLWDGVLPLTGVLGGWTAGPRGTGRLSPGLGWE